MKNAWVVGLGFAFFGCGASPAETAFVLRMQNAWCDKIHASLTETQRTVPFSFFLGANAGECKAAFNAELADSATQSLFGDRKFVATAGDACIDAINKLATQDVLNLLNGQINISKQFDDTLQNTARKDAKAKLGLAEDFSCRVDATTCRADPGCSIGNASGACAIYKWAPLKDSTLAAKEQEFFTATGGSVNGCGSMGIF